MWRNQALMSFTFFIIEESFAASHTGKGILKYDQIRFYLGTILDQWSLEEMYLLQPGLGVLHLLHARVPVLCREDLSQGVVIAVRVLVNHCEHPAMPSLRYSIKC